MTYARFMRRLGRVLLAVSAPVVVLGVWAALSFAGTYGWGGVGGVFSDAVTIMALAAVPAAAGWLVLRIGRKAD